MPTPWYEQISSERHPFRLKFDLHVYLVPIQGIPAGPSKGAAVLLSIRPPTMKGKKLEPRLRMRVSRITRAPRR